MRILNILFFVVTLVLSTRAELEAIVTKSKLPVAAALTRSIYDGEGNIFIFGGDSTESGFLSSIHKYQISTDEITTVANFPSGRFAGGILSNSAGTIFYFGGGDPSYLGYVFKFFPSNASLVHTSGLSFGFAYGSVFTNPNDSNVAYRIGGDGFSTPEYIYCYDMSSGSNCRQTELTGGSGFERNSGFAIGERAFVFGRDTDILLLNLTSLESTIEATNLPKFDAEPTLVSDGSYGYLLAGWINSLETPVDSIIKFNPDTLTHEFIHVKNHPAIESKSDFFFSPSAVYVEELNRIYVIGGYSYPPSKWYDEIWYVDLSPTDSTEFPTTTLNPDFFTCNEKPNGMYPHPSDCSLYIGCYNEQLTIHSCSPPLLFNPVTSGCDFPEEVDCQLSCNGKPNGFYPHPHSCALYIGCHDGLVEIHKCSFPLHFDPDLLTCWFPEEVNCRGE